MAKPNLEDVAPTAAELAQVEAILNRKARAEQKEKADLLTKVDLTIKPLIKVTADYLAAIAEYESSEDELVKSRALGAKQAVEKFLLMARKNGVQHAKRQQVSK